MTRLAYDESGNPIQMIAQGARQTVPVGAAWARSANAFAATTNAIEMVSTTDCWYLLGDATVTVATSGPNLGTYLPAGAIKYQRVEKDVDTHMAVIQHASVGTMCITEGR